jgi:hypothetical protein
MSFLVLDVMEAHGVTIAAMPAIPSREATVPRLFLNGSLRLAQRCLGGHRIPSTQ